MFVNIYDYLVSIVSGSASFTNWLFNPIWNGVSPISLLTFTGLTIYLGVAIVKWAIS